VPDYSNWQQSTVLGTVAARLRGSNPRSGTSRVRSLEPNIRPRVESGIFAGCLERLAGCGGTGRRSDVPVYPNGRGTRSRAWTVPVRIRGRVPDFDVLAGIGVIFDPRERHSTWA